MHCGGGEQSDNFFGQNSPSPNRWTPKPKCQVNLLCASHHSSKFTDLFFGEKKQWRFERGIIFTKTYDDVSSNTKVNDSKHKEILLL